MPKQILKLDQFHGGLNSHADPRDIADNQLSALQNASISSIGRIVLAGGKTTIASTSFPAATGGDLNAGYGLFAFSADWDKATTPTNAETSYLVLWEDAEAKLYWVIDAASQAWSEVSSILTSAWATATYPCFYFIDGALRMSDGKNGAVTAAEESLWWGHIKQELFLTHGASTAVNNWFAYAQELKAPVSGKALGPNSSEVDADDEIADNDALSIHVRHSKSLLVKLVDDDATEIVHGDYTPTDTDTNDNTGYFTGAVVTDGGSHDGDNFFLTSIEWETNLSSGTLVWRAPLNTDIQQSTDGGTATFASGQSVYGIFNLHSDSAKKMWDGSGGGGDAHWTYREAETKFRLFETYNDDLDSANYMEWNIGDPVAEGWTIGQYRIVEFPYDDAGVINNDGTDIIPPASFNIARYELVFGVQISSAGSTWVSGSIPSSPFKWGQFFIGDSGQLFNDPVNSGKRKWGYSYIYGGKQESNIFPYADEIALSNNSFAVALTAYHKGNVGGPGAAGEQISDADNRVFSGSPDWTNAGGVNGWNQDSGTYDESATSGATEGTGFFTDEYLKLVATSHADNERYAYLDGAHWEDADGSSGVAMVTGKTYQLSYSIEITAHSSGTLSIGFSDTSESIDTDSDKTYTATLAAVTDSFDFVYAGTTTHAELLIKASTSSSFTVYFDNFSITEVQRDHRITGANIYFFDQDDVPYKIADCDFVLKGLKPESSSRFPDDTAWTELLSVIRKSNTITLNEIPLFTSYEALHGYGPEEGGDKNFKASFGNATLNGRRLIVGPMYMDTDDGATDQWHRDTMIGTSPGEYDLFPNKSRTIDVATEDGDRIMGLASYADRILQFKKNVMYLINITKSTEYLEDTFRGKGVVHPGAICKTDYGIAWANENGCFFYDGQKVENLSDMKISDGDWSTHIDDSGNSLVGYHPNSRKIIVTGGGTNNRNAYIFDLVTKSWAYTLALLDNVPMTNFVNNSSGDLLFATEQSGGLQKWTENPTATSSFSVITKDIDFGQPGQRKKIYKVYLTFKGVGTHVQVHYGVDGLTPASTFYTITSGTDGSSTGGSAAAKCIPYNAGTTDWLKAELKPSASISNVSSFRLMISGDDSNAIAASFEINDISIVYRLKPVK